MQIEVSGIGDYKLSNIIVMPSNLKMLIPSIQLFDDNGCLKTL